MDQGASLYRFDYSMIYPGSRGTVLNGINSHSDIVGVWKDEAGIVHGFYKLGDQLHAVDFPDSRGTFAQGVSDDRTIVGDYVSASGHLRGFAWKDGEFTTIDAPESVMTGVSEVSPEGLIVGVFDTTDRKRRSFQYQLPPETGQINTIELPSGYQNFHVHGVSSNTLVGFASEHTHGGPQKFAVIVRNGETCRIPELPNAKASMATAVNEQLDVIVGQYFMEGDDCEAGYNLDSPRGWILKDGVLYLFDVPGSRATGPIGVNRHGVIVGFYDDEQGNRLPFVAHPAS